MGKTSVLLTTGGHCIQSAAKDEFRRITRIILDSADNDILPVLAEQLELLKEFLENTDFNTLRASDERLAGIIDAECILERNGNGKPVVTVKNIQTQ